MTVFADSSAVVKLYIEEDGAAELAAMEAATMVVSELARVEVPAAVWRKQRMQIITAAEASVLVAGFEADCRPVTGDPRFVVIGVTPSILDGAARLCAVHGLRAYDAVQLSSACAAGAVLPECRTFAAFDKDLRAAAAAEGFRVLPAD